MFKDRITNLIKSKTKEAQLVTRMPQDTHSEILGGTRKISNY